VADDDVFLRPVQLEDLALLDRSGTPQDDPFNFFGFQGGRRLRQRFDENGLLGADFGNLIVQSGEVAVGDVSWHAEAYGPPAAGVAFNIGISLLTEHRGRGVGTIAQRKLAAYLFATSTVHRIEATTDIENIAEQRALEKAGFRRDGVLRGAQWRHGAWHDMVVYSRLRTDA
jgi:aminoglycoside 6'-N-acetyltransferase